MKNLCFLFFIIGILNQSYAQWYWMNPLPQGNDLYSIQFLDDSVGFAVGNNGTMIKTTDKGANWEIIHLGTNYHLTSLIFTEDGYGYIAGNLSWDMGIILKSSDYGETWNKILDTLCYFNNVFFLDKENGLISGDKLFRTQDGGQTWSYITTPNSGRISFIYFIDPFTGFVGDFNKKIYKTTDGGITWSQNTVAQPVFTMQFLNENDGFAAGYWGMILKTANGGNSWINLSNSTTTEFTSMFFFDCNVGYISGANQILKTVDGGNNWSATTVYGSHSIYFTDSTNGYTVGHSGHISKTDDHGGTWNELSKGVRSPLSSVFFLNNETGYVTAWGSFLKTVDGGVNWTQTDLDPYSSYNDIYFFNDTVGLITGYRTGNDYYGFTIKTNDAGLTWDTVIYKAYTVLNSLYFINQTTGFVIGSDQIIYKTTDMGNTWSLKSWGGNYSYYSITFINEGTGYIAGGDPFSYGSEGIILKSTDSGETWSVIYNEGSNYPFYSICFVSENIGYIVGGDPFVSGGVIMKTTNGGDNWQIQLSGTDVIYNSVYFIDEYRGFAAGTSGVGIISETIDGGETWNIQVDYAPSIHNLCFIDDTTGFAVGDVGTILKTTSGCGTASIHNKVKKENTVCIYPNPAHNLVFIKNNQTCNNFIIELFNTNGKFLQKIPLSGDHRITISGLIKGLYFIRIVDGHRAISTEKLIVL